MRESHFTGYILMINVQITVKGIVQMVGYRYYTLKHANHMGIKGFVKNLPSGEVEVFAQASEDVMKEFIILLRKGPSSAVVRDVEVNYSPEVSEKFSDFGVRY